MIESFKMRSAEVADERPDRVLVVIPAYNEEQQIEEVVASVAALPLRLDVLVVDDGSFDATAAMARAAGAAVLSHPVNMGYGAALQTGYKYAQRNDYDFVVQLDADGQHLPRYIPELIRELQARRADLVIGSRFSGVSGYRVPRLRRLGIHLFSTLVRLFTGQHIRDVTSGFQAANRKVVRLYASDYFPTDFPDADVLILMHRTGLLIKELPMEMKASVTGQSMHSGLSLIYYIVKMSLSIFITVITDVRILRRAFHDSDATNLRRDSVARSADPGLEPGPPETDGR